MTEQEMQFYCGEIRKLKQELKALKCAVHPLLREVRGMISEMLLCEETELVSGWLNLVEPVEKALKRKAKNESRVRNSKD